MSDSILESNLILKTRTEKPDLSGFNAVHASLSAMEKKLMKLTEKPWVIKLAVDDSQLKAAGIQIGKPITQNFSTGKASTPGAGPGGLYSRSTFSSGPKGDSLETLQKSVAIQDRMERTATSIRNQAKGTAKEIREQKDLAQDVFLKDQRRLAVASERLRLAQKQAALSREGQELGATVRSDVRRGQVPLTFERDSGGFLFSRIQASEREYASNRKAREAAAAASGKFQDDTHRRAGLYEYRSEQSRLEEQSRFQDRTYNRAGLRDFRDQERALLGQANFEDRTYRKAGLREFREQQGLHEFESNTHRRAGLRDYKDAERRQKAEAEAERRAYANNEKRQVSEHVRESQRLLRQQGIGGAIQFAEGQGFTQRQGPKITTDVLTGQLTRQTELARSTGNAFSGLTVEVLRFNEATGRVESEVLRGAKAIRYMGDSLSSAASKVLTWTLATAAIFATIGAISMAVQEIGKLEQGTVLLARVGRGLGADFEERIGPARELTAQIIELTTVYGGNATAATEAATVFARAGKSQKDILEGVRVSLIASKIAELEVGESAKLISSAMLQFDLKARDLLPTLDALNSLSNNYRVTTNDLLQSISRAGSVYADHNGRLTELASLTALVSQETSRSGAEIGNAFKTIISQLDRLDVQQDLFDQLGISTVNFAGESKSLVKILFEESLALERLSTAEQKQLTLKQAGIRQRGILIASLKNAPGAVIAENRALVEKSSAETEFKEGANTSIERLSRLQAEFIKFAHQGSGPIKALALVFLDLTSAILKTLNLFGGLGAKALAAGAVFLTVRYALINVINGLIAMSIQMGIASTAATTLNAAMGNWIAVAATAAIGLYALVSAQTDYTLSAAEAVTAVESNIASEEQRRKAIIDTTEAIYRLTEANKKNRDEEAKKLAESIGLKLPAGAVTATGLEGASKQGQLESIERQKEKLKELKFLKEQELEAARKLEMQNKTTVPFGYWLTTNPSDDVSPSDRYNATNAGKIRNIKSKNAREKLEQELKDIETQSENLIAVETSFKGDAKQKELGKRISESNTTFYNRDREQAARDFETSFSSGNIEKASQEYNKLSSSVEDYATALAEAAELNKDSNNQNFLEDQKKLNEVLQEQVKAYEALSRLKFNRTREQVSAGLSNANKLREGIASIDTERERGLAGASVYGNNIAQIDASRQAQIDRIARNREVVRGLDGQTGPGIAGAADAAKKDTEEALLKLKDLELEKALAIKEAEKDIALERKKSADEALRAVGALSDEDKLRFRAQAAYFAKNPGAKISVEQQLTADSSTNSIANQFFKGRLEQFSDSKGGVAERLRKAGFGSTPELDKGEAELAKIRGGRSDEDIINGALGRANQFDDDVAKGRHGGDASDTSITDFLKRFGIGGGAFDDKGKSKGDHVNVDVTGDAFDISPLVDSFRGAVTTIMEEKVREMAAEVQRIVDQGRALPINKPKRVAGNAVN